MVNKQALDDAAYEAAGPTSSTARTYGPILNALIYTAIDVRSRTSVFTMIASESYAAMRDANSYPASDVSFGIEPATRSAIYAVTNGIISAQMKES
jgi:hypothetical protein